MATTTGYQAVRPAASQMIKFASQLNVMESSLGLTAKARSRMRITPPAAPDALDEFLAAYP
jgi:phage terminase small subunit